MLDVQMVSVVSMALAKYLAPTQHQPIVEQLVSMLKPITTTVVVVGSSAKAESLVFQAHVNVLLVNLIALESAAT